MLCLMSSRVSLGRLTLVHGESWRGSVGAFVRALFRLKTEVRKFGD